ncbi:MAG: fatty acid CoA ligase family protein [Planctomycetota bacterium]
MSELFNVAQLVEENARRRGDARAIAEPRGARWRTITYRELQRLIEHEHAALARAGLRRGDKVSVFVRPGIDWVVLIYALFRLGAQPVLIDPAMGRTGVLRCVERIAPRGFVGIPLACALKLVFPRAFRSVEVTIAHGALPLGGRTISSLRKQTREFPARAEMRPDELAAVLFTSGSTGPAKGVPYTHGMFRAQVAALRDLYAMREGDVDVACFAPFALFGPALGLSTVLPKIDFSHPARANPEHVVRALREHRAVQCFGSPAIWRRVAPWARERGIVLEHLERLMIAGAPVHPPLIEACLSILGPRGDVHTPYGATEALPVSSMNGRAVLAEHRARPEGGWGNCVGAPESSVNARVISIGDDPIAEWSDALCVKAGECGELVVRGEQVTREYEQEPSHTRAAKIRDGASVWHRMGDVVRLDELGRMWFQGRKSHRVETSDGPLYPVAIENIFNTHAAVRRSALVGIGARGSQEPVLVVELYDATRPSAKLAGEILAHGRRVPAARPVSRVLFHRAFPVDVRHNAKIDRPALARWAAEQAR